MSENNNDIIVIGAGCGGLTAAACAAKEGKKVLLLERHNAPGGFNSSFIRGRFEFDVSLHELCGFGKEKESGDLRKIFDYLGISDKIDWIHIPSACRLITKSHDGSNIDITLPFGVDNFINALDSYVPGSRESLIKLFEVAEEIEKSIEHFSDFDGKYSFHDLRIALKEHSCFLKTAPYSVNKVFESLGIPQKARDILNAYWVYLGVDCDRLSFTHYITMLYTFIKYGAVIPKDRSYALSMALTSVIEDYNGEIRYNSHVSRIKFKDRHASSVILKSGEKIYCNHIICTCSPTVAYGKMMKAKDVPQTALKRTNARTFGARGARLYIGLNRSPQDLGIKDYSVFITDTADTSKQFELMKTIDTNNAQVAVCLNIANPDCSPVGTTILCITALYTDNCWANIEAVDYFNEKDKLAARLIANYENTTGVIIHNSIEELEVATPMTFARYTATPQGTVYGYYGDDWDGIIPRIMTEATDCDTNGLRFCGGWGAQLAGVNSVVASGRNAAFATLADIQNSQEESTIEKNKN